MKKISKEKRRKRSEIMFSPKLVVLFVLVLPGCVSLGQDERLTEIAQEEWTRVGAPERFDGKLEIRGELCLGSPGVRGESPNILRMYVPWPWNYWEGVTRAIMRYELSKAAWQMQGLDGEGGLYWFFPIVWLDGLLHLPPSELNSWYYAICPGELGK